jgi:hypothetical protein
MVISKKLPIGYVPQTGKEIKVYDYKRITAAQRKATREEKEKNGYKAYWKQQNDYSMVFSISDHM